MMKGICRSKIKSKENYIKTLQEEIEDLIKKIQNIEERLEELQPQEDDTLNSYFQAIQKYLEAKDDISKGNMKQEEAKYNEVCTKIRWQESSKKFINSKLNGLIAEKTQLEDEVEVLKTKLAKC